MEPIIIVLIILVVLVFIALIKTIQVIPQASAAIVERFGRYTRTLNAGLNIVVPFIDSIRNRIDLREQVVPFPPQPVITQDNLVVNIDTVIYYQVTDARAATYEVASYIQAIEQLTVTTLRNIIGGMDLERTLTSREEINAALRGVLDEATGKWGIRVNRVELKAIEPPTSIQDSMEKQMRADRDKRAAILTAEGTRQAAILTAEGEKQSQILRAEGEAKAAALRAEGEAQAVRTVFEAIHAGDPDQKLLSYQYLQMLPKIAEGDANKLWIVPSEIGDALKGLSGAMGNFGNLGGGPGPRPADGNSERREKPADRLSHTDKRARRAPIRAEAGRLFRGAGNCAISHRRTRSRARAAFRRRAPTPPRQPRRQRVVVLVPQRQQHRVGRRRLERLPQQRHPRLLRSPVGLAVVVLGARRDRVQPGVTTAPRPRHHMVHGRRPPAAVRAPVPVPYQDTPPRPRRLSSERHPDIPAQPDHPGRRYVDRGSAHAQFGVGLLDDGLVL